MEPIDEIIARAMKRGEAAMKVDPKAVFVRFDKQQDRIVLGLEGGAELSIPIAALGFKQGAMLSDVRLEGGGFDLYFPSLDEGAFVPDLTRAAIEHRLAA